MRRLGLLFLFALLSFPAGAVQDVANTLHNLSSSGPGTFKSLTVDEVCVFCHTPHTASPSIALWNHTLSGQTYITYDSTTLEATPGEPSGKSRLCLACHDGTVALGALGNLPPGQVNDLQDKFLKGRASLGTALSDDHPVSFKYDAALGGGNRQLANPVSVDLPLEGDQMQCTTCHDPHERDVVPFLRKTSQSGKICTACHTQNGAGWSWPASSHATSTARGGNANPWAERKPAWRGNTVADNACFNCHAPHNAATPPRLVKNVEEDTCFLCHDGGVAATDIQFEVRKPSGHDVTLSTGDHDAAENFSRSGSPPPAHVECVDCHNPHAGNNTTAPRGSVPGPLLGVKGIDSRGGRVTQARADYEVCYKCHADNNVRPSPSRARQADASNVRRQFDVSNPSFHPVQGPGRNPNAPSLVSQWRASSVMSCGDCHNNDDPGGPRGPHGSMNRQLLERNYTTGDNTPESTNAYALCYKCHNRSSIMGDQSFSEHDRHIRGENTPCSACHDPHGIDLNKTSGASDHSHLINFDVSIVSPRSNGDLRFEDLGTFSGRCYLVCHGRDHDPLTYP
jgi:predicted CXXCH cytochrome family protein